MWGRGRPARRGLWAARRTGLPVLSVEEPFLRGLRPGSSGTPPLGLLLDDLGIHFDASRPSRLERILASDPLDDGTAALEMWRRLGLSKVNQWSDEPAPEPGYVLVIDQMRGDASIAGGDAEAASFRRMLEAARAENPRSQILIRTNPQVIVGRGTGHFTPADAGGRVGFAPPRLAPPALLNAAHRVYAVSSQMGFEAILLGHRPRLFGVPFYAGWGLSEDEIPCSRRRRALTPDMLFAGSMLRYPVWYDPFADALCDFETVAEIAADEAQAWREAAAPSVCLGVRAWKRPTLQGFLTGSGGRPVHASHVDRAVTLARRRSGRIAVWASREPPELAPACSAAGLPMLRIEDGFLRSLGLGAKLVPATSLVLDDLGIYFDPTRPSRLEMLIAQSAELSATELARAAALRAEICAQGVSKYGAGLRRDVGPAFPPRAPGQRRVLVVGQVADDASVKLGA
ncbi:MAG: capsular polysaccharide biosynthesis protein, partial [Pseudomonadota bacterium]